MARAYESLVRRGSRNYSRTFRNDDGSVTLEDPRFNFRGKSYSFFGLSDLTGGAGTAQLTGVCRLFGFNAPVTYTEKRHNIAGGDFDRVILNSDGTLQVMTNGRHSTYNHYLQDITCR